MNIKETIFALVPFKALIGKVLCSRYIDSPVFVVGSGRSGTTAINDCLSRHPKIKSSRNEIPLGLHLLEMLYQASEGPKTDWYQGSMEFDLETLYGRIQRLLFESVWGSHYGLRRTLGVLKGALVSNSKYNFWSAKIFPKEHQIYEVKKLFSRAKFIYVVRNGAEVVNSMGEFGSFKNLSFQKRCEFWATSMENYHYLYGHDLSLVVRHEDFVEDAAKQILRICEHIGIEQSSGMLEQATGVLTHSMSLSEDVSLDVKTTLQRRKNPYQSWTLEQQQIFDRVCGRWMEELDYKV